MKNTFTILALAATAAATGFKDANPFSAPGNTDNKCTVKQSTGFDFSDLTTGGFSDYNNFNWKGWSCGQDTGKRFAPRTNSKKISASCGSTKAQSPSFGCGANIDKFSLGAITIKPEFSCDLEFHYDMPDGSTCKHRSLCDKAGTTVKNSQCGGAKNVTIVYPSQPSKPKPTCSVDVHTISFECSSSSTKPPKTTTKSSSAKTTSTSVATTTSETKAILTTSSSTAVETTSTAVETTSTAVETTSTSAETTSTSAETTTPPATTAPPVTLPPFVNGTITQKTTESIKETTSETTSEETSTFITSFLSTSTVFTTLVSTITSCAETVTNCPARSVTTTVVTVAVSTSICPVTETRTTVHTRTHTKPTDQSSATTTTSTVKAVETLPCPNVVPQCLNTFLFTLGCSDNSDSACYCPDEAFVKNTFNCIYAHGETDQIVTEAIIFFQGICAPYVPSNPAIVTGATVTSFVTAGATATTSLAPVYTTVTVQVTTVVPCTDSAGSTIASSSSTIIINTEMTVPQVAFTTGTGTGSSVGLVPATATVTAPTGAATTKAASLVTAAPSGTGSFTPKSSLRPATISGSGRVTAGLGLALAVMALAAAL